MSGREAERCALSSANRWLVGIVLGLAVAIGLVLWLARPTYDLAYFLPAPETESERVLVERLGQGAGARLIFIELSAGTDAGEWAIAMRERLEGSPLFLRVEDGQRELAIKAIPEVVWRWRYLLTDVDWSVVGLRMALEQRVGDMASLGGPEFARLVASDPLWAAPTVLDRLRPGAGKEPRWSAGPGSAFLLVETVAPPFDLAAQQQSVDAIRTAYRDVSGKAEGIEMYGVGVYGARVQALIQRETQVLGVVATVAVLLIVTFAYRSPRLTLLSLLPLFAAVLGGLLAVSLVFERIHGITIAFGATLIGVVDDYPMHLFSHARHMAARDGVRLLFRTLMVSAGTTVIAYAAMLVSGSGGLAQLGVFSLAGIVCAMAVTCWVLPRVMLPVHNALQDTQLQLFQLSPRIWLPLLLVAAAVLGLRGGVHWNDDLSAVTPLPPELLARDHAMRQRFGAPDVRYLLSITADSSQSVLRQTEALEQQLLVAREAGLVQSWSAVTSVLPSQVLQVQRQAAIPSLTELQERMRVASRGLPFRDGAFDKFLAEAAHTRTLPLLSAAEPVDAFSADLIGTHLSEGGGSWRSVIFLTGMERPSELDSWLRERTPGAVLVDLKAASESLVGDYRVRLMRTLGGAVVLIAMLIIGLTGSVRRFVWTVGTVTAAISGTLAILVWVQGAISLFHLVSLVLVAGLGVDYCLFYSRPGVSRTEFLDTRHAVIACAASTAGAFAILSSSSIPLLSDIGMTVAMGTLILFVAARVGCCLLPGPTSGAS